MTSKTGTAPAGATHRSLTEAYLARISAGRTPADLTTVRDSVADTSYHGRALSRPAFLGAAEYRRLTADLDHCYNAIAALPDRLFGGDAMAFARAVGFNEIEAAAVVRGRGPGPTRLARADLYLERDGFRLLELNFGSTMGGLDNALLNQAMLADPTLAGFVDEHGLTYVDTVRQAAATMLAECHVRPGTRPTLAVVHGDSSTQPEPRLRRSAGMLAQLGIDADVCHARDLRYDAGRVWLGDRPVDLVYRLFHLEDLLDDAGRAALEPLLRAAERGQVKLFTAMDSRMYGSKAVLAMLSDEANRHLLTDGQRAAVDRLVPWTRMLRPRLREFVLANRKELVLKPALMHGGIDVRPGWLIEPGEWREQVEAAMDGPYVVQRRVHPMVEWFPSERGIEPWILVWAAFLMSRGQGGIWVRGAAGTVGGVVNMAQGSTATCCFHQPA